MRADRWEWFGGDGLNPTQGQILLLLRRHREPLRMSQIADELSVTAATVSDSVAALIEKGLVVKTRSASDRRAAAVSLKSQGRKRVDAFNSQEHAVESAVKSLPQSEKVSLFTSMLKVIRELQTSGRIPMARMCVTCRYFRPNAHGPGVLRPHHCALVDAPLANQSLRQDCPEHEAADEHLARSNWQTFTDA